MGEAPRRTCVGCRRTRDKAQLLRLVATRDGVAHDRQMRLPGRGAYVCPDPRCIDAAATRDASPLRRALRGIPADTAGAALATLRQIVQDAPGGGDQPHQASPEEQNA